MCIWTLVCGECNMKGTPILLSCWQDSDWESASHYMNRDAFCLVQHGSSYLFVNPLSFQVSPENLLYSYFSVVFQKYSIYMDAFKKHCSRERWCVHVCEWKGCWQAYQQLGTCSGLAVPTVSIYSHICITVKQFGPWTKKHYLLLLYRKIQPAETASLYFPVYQ